MYVINEKEFELKELTLRDYNKLLGMFAVIGQNFDTFASDENGSENNVVVKMGMIIVSIFTQGLIGEFFTTILVQKDKSVELVEDDFLDLTETMAIQIIQDFYESKKKMIITKIAYLKNLKN